eukprot:843599-Pelagomonas_calceolata.AAC.4
MGRRGSLREPAAPAPPPDQAACTPGRVHPIRALTGPPAYAPAFHRAAAAFATEGAACAAGRCATQAPGHAAPINPTAAAATATAAAAAPAVHAVTMLCLLRLAEAEARRWMGQRCLRVGKRIHTVWASAL